MAKRRLDLKSKEEPIRTRRVEGTVSAADHRLMRTLKKKHWKEIRAVEMPPKDMGKREQREFIVEQLKRKNINKYEAYAIASRMIR